MQLGGLQTPLPSKHQQQRLAGAIAPVLHARAHAAQACHTCDMPPKRLNRSGSVGGPGTAST